MSQGSSSSLRFGDVICLGLECPGPDDSDELIFYVLGHQSPLSLVKDCQDVIDHVLVAEMPNTFSAPSKKDGSDATFPVPVHSREYWFEIVGKSEYMLQQTLQKMQQQLEHLEAQQVRMVQADSEMDPPLSAEPAAASPAGAGVGTLSPIQTLRRPAHNAVRRGSDAHNVLRRGNDIELSEVNVALLAGSDDSPDARSAGGLTPLTSPPPFTPHTLMTSSETSAPVAQSVPVASKAIENLKSRIADLKELTYGETQRNLENELSRKGSGVRYGDVIQLRHVLTKKFVSLANGAISSYELSHGNMNCWFIFEPGFKLSAIGDPINLDAEDKLSVRLMSASSQTEGKVYMSISGAEVKTSLSDADSNKRASLSINLALDGVLEPSGCIPIRTVSSGNVQNRISIFRAGDSELVARTQELSSTLSGSTIVRFYYRECDSFLAGKRADNPDLPTKPFLIPAADCTTAKIHDFALTLWFLVDGDGNLAGCGDTLDLGSMVVLQHVVTGLILIAEQNPKYVKPAMTSRRSSRFSQSSASPTADIEKSPEASPEVVKKAQKSWGLARNVVKAGMGLAEKSVTRDEVSSHHVVESKEPFFNLVLLSLKSVEKAQEDQDQDTSVQKQFVTRWQLSPPSNKKLDQSSDAITNKSLFLLTSCDCDKITSTEHHTEIFSNVIIGVEPASVNEKQLPVMGMILDCADEKLPEHLFNVEFISPRMLEFVEKPRSVVFSLYTFYVELQSFASRVRSDGGLPDLELCSFIDKYGLRMKTAFELFARLCCSNSKDEIDSDVPLERLTQEVPNRKMQLLFGQLGAVALIGSLIQTLQTIWQGGDLSIGEKPPSYPHDVSQILEDIVGVALIAFVSLCSGSPENKKIVSPDMLEFLAEKLLPFQTLSDTVVRVMVALAAENQPVVLKLNKNKNSALSKIICLLREQRRSTFVDFLSSFLFVNGLPMPEYQRILLDTAFLPDVAFIAAGSPQESFFPRVKFDSSDEARLSCHILMEHPLDWGVWPLSDGKTNLIDVLLSHKEKPLPQTISLGKFEFNNDIMTFQFEPGLDPRLKSQKEIEDMKDPELKSLVDALCVLRIQYLCSLFGLVSSLCHGRNAYCRDFFRYTYNYSNAVIGEDSEQSGASDIKAASIIPDFDTLLLGVVEDKMPAALKSACVQLLHTLYVSNDPWTEQDILPAIVIDKSFPLTDSRDQPIMKPAQTPVSAISFEKLTSHLKDTSHVVLDPDRRNLSFQAPITVDFPFNFAELNGHHYFECQVTDDPASVLDFAIGFTSWSGDGDKTQFVDGSKAQPNKLMWSGRGLITGVSQYKGSLQVASITVSAPVIRHGDVVGCGISYSNQFFFTLNQRVFFLYKNESMPTFSASFASPFISANEEMKVPFSITIRDIQVASSSELQSNRSRSVSVASFVESPQHSISSTTISNVLLPQCEKFAVESSRIEKLLRDLKGALSEDDILEKLFTPTGEDAKLMMKSLCKLIESALRLQIDDSDEAYKDIISIMQSTVRIFEYLSLTYELSDYPERDDEDEDGSDKGPDDEGSPPPPPPQVGAPPQVVVDSGSVTSSTAAVPKKHMDEETWSKIFEKGSSTDVLLYSCSLLNTLFDLLVKRRVQVFSNHIQDNDADAVLSDADELLRIVAADAKLSAAHASLNELEKFLHVACRCPDDIVKSVVLKLLFEYQTFQAGFIRSLIPVIYIDTLPRLNPEQSPSLALSNTTEMALANVARSLERTTKLIRLSESSVRSFLADPVFEVRFIEPLIQLWNATEDLISLIMHLDAYGESLHASLINDMESPCEVLFDRASISKWTGSQGSSFAPTSSSASNLAHKILNSANARISLDNVVKKDAPKDQYDEILHRVGAMFIAAEVDQAITSLLDIPVVSSGENRDAVKQKSALVAVSIVESIFLRMMDALCAAAMLSADCQNGIATHALKLRALLSPDDSVNHSLESKVAHRSRLSSGAAKVLIRLLHENTVFAASLHSEDVTTLANISFVNPDHFIIGITHSILFQRDLKSQKVHYFSMNQSLVFSSLMEAIRDRKKDFRLVEQMAHPSGILQKCFNQDSIQSDANRTTRCNPAFLLHMDVVRLMSACVRGNNFTKASIAPIISLSDAFRALSLLLTKPSQSADVQLNVAIEWASSSIVYYCEFMAHAHLISSHKNAAPERRDEIPFATKDGLVPVLGAFVSAAIRVIQPLALDASMLQSLDGSVESLLLLFPKQSYFYAGARSFMSLVAGKIADHCLSNRANAAMLPTNLEDFARIIQQFEQTENPISRQFDDLQINVKMLRVWKNSGPKIFYSLSSATLLFLMTKYHTDSASFTCGQLDLAFGEIVSSLMWVQRAAIQIVPSFLSLYSSKFLPPLHEENRTIIVELGKKLSSLEMAYQFSKAGNHSNHYPGFGLSSVRDNILKHASGLLSADGVHSWLAPKKHAKTQIVSLIDDADVAAIFENPEFFDKNLPIKSFHDWQNTFFPEVSHKNVKKGSARAGRKKSAAFAINLATAKSPWSICVSKLSNKSKLSMTEANDCIADGRFDIAYALLKSGLPIRKETEAEQHQREEAEADREIMDVAGRGWRAQGTVWLKSFLKFWILFTRSFSKWILDVTVKLALFGYRVVARVSDLLGIKEFLFLSSLEEFVKAHDETTLENCRFLAMDARYKRTLLNVNLNDDKDPHLLAAIRFSDASPPTLVHSLVKSISIMESAKAVIGLGDPEREGVLDQFFLQALEVLRLHLYTAPCMTRGEAKMRARAFNLKSPVVVSTSTNSWMFRLNMVQNHLALGYAGAAAASESATTSDVESSSHHELLSALIHLSLSTSPTPSIRVAAIECLSTLFCGCSQEIRDSFGCHPLVESPANSFFLSLAEAFDSFRKSAHSRAIDLQKFSDIYEAVSVSCNILNPGSVAPQHAKHHDDHNVDHSINPAFLMLLKAEAQRRLSFDAPPAEASNSIFAFISEGIGFITTFIMGASDETGEEFDTTEAPIFVKMLLKFIPITRLRSLFRKMLSRLALTIGSDAAEIPGPLKDVVVVASKQMFARGLELFLACNSLTRNLLVSSATFKANVSFQELIISQEKHADPANNVDVSSRILDIIIESLDAIQSGTPDFLYTFTVVSCYVNLQKLCFGQNAKVIAALSESSFLTVYNRTITVMLSVFSFLSQKTGDAPIYLDGFHPIDVVLSMILLLRNLCTSDTENKTCPEVYAGISWNNLFKLSVKVAQHYKLDKPEDDGIAFFSLASIANIRSTVRDLFANLFPNAESNSDLRRQLQLAGEVLAGVYALKETVAYHSEKDSPVSMTLAKLFRENHLDELPIFSGTGSRICRIEIVRRDGKAELMFFQKPDELCDVAIDAGDLMPIRDSHGESLRSHIVEAERMRLSVIAREAFGAKFFRKLDYVPLVIGSLINLLLILFLALKVNGGDQFDGDAKHPAWRTPLELNFDNFANVMSWQGCEEDCKLDENPLAKIVPNIFTQFRDGGGGDTFIGTQCDQFDPLLNATEYSECFKFSYSESTQSEAAVAIGVTFLLLAFANIIATGSNLLSWIYYSSHFVVRETVLNRWYRDCKDNGKPMFFTELEAKFVTADSFKIIIRNLTFWWLILKCGAAFLTLFVHPILSVFFTFDAFRIKQVDYIFSAFTVKGKEFITLFLLISAVIYLNAVFGIVFYWDQMKNWSLQCSSLFQCTVSFFIVGWTGSIGDLMDAPEDDLGYPKYADFRGAPGQDDGDGRLMFRLIWQLAFFIVVPTCLISVVTGIIIDSFNEMRQSINERREKLENSCFVCDISSDVWRKVALEMSIRQGAESLSFSTHVLCEHNILDYFYIFFRVRSARAVAHFTDQEHDLRRRFNQLDFTVFPMDQVKLLQRNSLFNSVVQFFDLLSQALTLVRANGLHEESEAPNDGAPAASSHDAKLAALEEAVNQLSDRLMNQMAQLQQQAAM